MQPRAEGRIELLASDDQAGALQKLVDGAERTVRIFSDALDPALFDHLALADSLSRLVRRARQCEVRILIKDSHNLVHRAHQLGSLHRRLSSSVQIRKLGHIPEHYVVNYVLVDDRGVLFLPMDDDKVCFLNPDDRALVRHYGEQFDELWARSSPDEELRTMPI